MIDDVVFNSSWRLVTRYVLIMLLLFNTLFGLMYLFISNSSDDSITFMSILKSLPGVWDFLLFLFPFQVGFLLIYIGGCYVKVSCDAQAITIHKPFALFGRNQVQPVTGLQSVAIANFKSRGFLFKRAASKDERVEFDFLVKESLERFAAFLQRHAVATINFQAE